MKKLFLSYILFSNSQANHSRYYFIGGRYRQRWCIDEELMLFRLAGLKMYTCVFCFSISLNRTVKKADKYWQIRTSYYSTLRMVNSKSDLIWINDETVNNITWVWVDVLVSKSPEYISSIWYPYDDRVLKFRKRTETSAWVQCRWEI